LASSLVEQKAMRGLDCLLFERATNPFGGNWVAAATNAFCAQLTAPTTSQRGQVRHSIVTQMTSLMQTLKFKKISKEKVL